MVHGTHNAEADDRNTGILININGALFTREEAKISVFDAGYLVGDGVWEAMRLHHGKLVFKEQHYVRLQNGLKATGIDLGLSLMDLDRRIMDTLEANGMTDGIHVRVMVTRGNKKTPSQDPRLTVSAANIVIIPEYKKASLESKEKGIELYTSTIRRGSPDYLDPKLNCHSKLHEVLALNQAIQAGADEALMLDIHGFVSTCNSTNFFIVKNEEVWTSTGAYCMNGITRQNIIDISRDNGIVCLEKNFSLYDVYGADEAFVTGSFGGLTPVIRIDGKTIGDGTFGSMSRKLSDLYNDRIRSEVNNAK